jgi:hypothetical protein
MPERQLVGPLACLAYAALSSFIPVLVAARDRANVLRLVRCMLVSKRA